MSETFFRTEAARADRKNTLLFFYGRVLIFFLFLCGIVFFFAREPRALLREKERKRGGGEQGREATACEKRGVSKTVKRPCAKEEA